MNNAILTSVFIFLFACRSRTESSVTRAVETTAFNGRVAIFDVYDKDKRLTRQAPGVLVSARGVLMPGLRADETVVLADSQRKGEKYIPLPVPKGGVTFIGLEAKATESLGLVPTTDNALPPLSEQKLKPISYVHTLNLKKAKHVIMFNEFGYLDAYAKVRPDGKIAISHLQPPHGYLDGGFLNMIYEYFVPHREKTLRRLSKEEGERVIRKGGALILAEPKYDNIVNTYDGWSLRMSNSPDPYTLDIVGFLAEDNEWKLDIPPGHWLDWRQDFVRDDIVSPAVRKVFESVAVKMNLPREFQREILEYVACYPIR